MPLQISIARLEHGGKAGSFFLSPSALARLLEVPLLTDGLESSLAVYLFAQPPQTPLHGLAFS